MLSAKLLSLIYGSCVRNMLTTCFAIKDHNENLDFSVLNYITWCLLDGKCGTLVQTLTPTPKEIQRMQCACSRQCLHSLIQGLLWISVLDVCCEARWDFWSSGWFGATDSWGTQYCQSNRHKASRCLDTYRVVRDLEERGTITQSHSPSNSPVWLVKKPNWQLWLTDLLQKIECQYCAFNHCCAVLQNW